MILPGSYANGFAPRDGEPLYPELQIGCIGAWSPGLGPTGTVLRDWSGRHNHGTLTGMDPGTDWIPSEGQWALDFDGSNDHVLTTSPLLFGLGNFAIVTWIKTTTTAGVNAYGTVDDGTASIFSLRLNVNTSGAPTPGTTWFQVRDDSGNTRNVSTTANIYDGQWHCVTCQRDSATTTAVFIDGQSVTLTVGANALSGSVDTQYPVAFGAWNLRGVAGLFAAMSLGCVRVYTRALSPHEIRLLATRRGIAHELAPIRYSGTSGFLAAWRRQQSFIIGGGLQ